MAEVVAFSKSFLPVHENNQGYFSKTTTALPTIHTPHDSYLESTLSEPFSTKIDILEREMKRNQATAENLMHQLESDIDMQRMLRAESKVAMERLKLVKTDMVYQLNEANNHFKEERAEFTKQKAIELAAKDKIIAEYESERSNLRKLAKRLAIVTFRKLRGKKA
jgi:hypothetical protein